jgi:A/G-specific adenine glycosylase
VFSEKLLTWYDRSQRRLPWRIQKKNPYYTWLSEIMLQQTTVVTVIPYFNRFTQNWPTIQNLAAASLDEVLIEWQGLGYYSRARNLHKCSQHLAESFPQEELELVKLPGIGPYTAAAIASIAFNKKAAAVDGNVIRVLCRYYAIDCLKPYEPVRTKLLKLLPETRCGDFTEALMELGALICRPKNPLCESCPLQKTCTGYKMKKVESFPTKPVKKKLPIRYTTAFIIQREDGAIWLRRRPLKGLLGGMMEVPSTPWTEANEGEEKSIVKHTFTHFHLKASLCYMDKPTDTEGIWVQPQDLNKHALPTVMKKIIRAGLKERE